MTAQEKKLQEAGFDHPCKQTCSGWQQGYERGYAANEVDTVVSRDEKLVGKIKSLESKLAVAVEEIGKAINTIHYGIESHYFAMGKEYLSLSASEGNGEIKRLKKVLFDLSSPTYKCAIEREAVEKVCDWVGKQDNRWGAGFKWKELIEKEFLK